MLRHSKMLLGLAVMMAFVARFTTGCGGGEPVLPTGKSEGQLAGLVIKGPLVSGVVTAYQLDDSLARGRALGSATTDDSGAFRIDLPSFNGPLLLVASSGTYTEEAIGFPVKLDGHELTLLLPEYKSGSKVEGLRLTPISTLATAATTFHVRVKGKDVKTAALEAATHLNGHFGNLDWARVTPADVTAPGVANISPEATAGLILAGLSYQARQMAEQSGVSPGLVVNAATLTTALAQDLAADGTLDGIGPSGAISQAKVKLDGSTARQGLAQALAAFIGSDRNGSALRLPEVKPLIDALATNGDPWLFCPQQETSPTCTASGIDVEAPVIVFVSPESGSGVRASAELRIRAEDETEMASLALASPGVVVTGVQTTYENDRKVALLTGTLDVSSREDGPLELKFIARDVAGNTTERTLSIIVANKGPVITVGSPSAGLVVSGAVLITATAQAQAGAVAKLELRNAPPGVGTDQVPAADTFAASWDTTKSPEGLVTLTFRAEDTLGGFADVTVDVHVDNVPFGTVTTQLSAGAPIAGATVQLLAIDAATGLPVSGRAGGAVLGQGGPTQPDGTLTFTLSQENWSGPVQLVASGNALSYVDPSDGVTVIHLPSTFKLTSYIPQYTTGTTLTAPITLWTSLADSAVRAVAQGLNPSLSTPQPLPQAQALVDGLFVSHVSKPVTWSLRDTHPVSLTQPPSQSLRDVVFAAMPDVALNQLARELAVLAGLTPGSAFNAPMLVDLLRQDLAADGLFDGRAGMLQLRTGGTTPQDVTANTTRFALAIALDGFVRGPQNQVGISRSDLLNGSPRVYDNFSLDQSVLYPSSQPPIPFDNMPPTVTFTVRFAGPDGSTNNLPVGPSQLVSHVVTVEAVAADPSGVHAISLEMAGNPLTPAAGSTSSRFIAVVQTTQDGPLTFTATATDKLSNTGTSSTTVTVDNTKPTISAVHPQPGFYSQSYRVEAFANDNTSLASFDLLSPAGAVDGDSALNHIDAAASSWTLAPALVDGPTIETFTACDVVRNCETSTRAVTIDRTAPTLSLVGSVPQHTNQSSVTFAVTAADLGAGVKSVHASRNGSPQVQATLVGGEWQFPPVALGNGSNTITVWAEDLAMPANSGQGRGGTHELTLQVRRDTQPPSVTAVPAASYRSEDGMGFQTNADGSPVMPVVYTYASSARVDLNTVTALYKSAARLSWGPTAPTAAQLEGTNAFNTPFFKIAIPYDAAVDAPITSVTFSFTVQGCTGCTGAVTTQAVPAIAAAPTTGFLNFLLPIALETLPELARTGSNGTLQVETRVTATDAAGNSAIQWLGARLFHVQAPTLAWVRDMNYAAKNDPRSVFPYRVSNQSYPDLFNPNNANFAPDNFVRVVRYVAHNPHSVPVGFYTLPASSFGLTTYESWGAAAYALPGADGDTYQLDGQTFRVGPYWDANPGSTFQSVCGAGDYFPCGAGQRDSRFPIHIIGNTNPATQYVCRNLPAPPSSAPETLSFGRLGFASDSFRYFVNANSTATETTAPVQVTGGYRVVPPATGSSSGTVAVYVGGPRATTRTKPLAWGANPYDPTPRYQFWYADFWSSTGTNGYCCAPQSQPSACLTRYRAHRWYEVLGTVETRSHGATPALDVTTTGLMPNGSGGYERVGPGIKTISAQTFTVQFTH